MRQYRAFKQQHPGCLLLFRMGDFYEMFYEDAVTASKALGLTLTQRTKGVPMAGMPHHQLTNYLTRLIDQGFRVAVADQVQDPSQAKGLVERAVTQVVTPGTRIDEALLDDDRPSRLAAILFTEPGDDSPAVGAVVDLGTGQLGLFDATGQGVIDHLAGQGVAEVLYADPGDGSTPPRVARVLEALDAAGTGCPSWTFRPSEAAEALHDQFGVSGLGGFGLDDGDPAIRPAGALVRYLRQTQALDAPGSFDSPLGGSATLAHLRPPRRDDRAGQCMVDAVTLRALEIERTIREGSQAGSLVGLFTGAGASCRTPMGRRLLRDWLCRPLGRLEPINARQACVAVLVEDRRCASDLRGALGGVQDVARISARIALGRATPRDIVALGASVARLNGVREAITGASAFAGQLDRLESLREALEPLARRIAETCVDNPPQHLRDGGLIRDGVDRQLDEARALKHDASAWLANYQGRLIEAHDLPGLKVGFNRIFGYYIELPKAQARRSPPEFARKQTLKNAERYTTPELKDFEDRVTQAEALAMERERRLFADLCARAAELVADLSAYAELIGEIDVLCALAGKAVARAWVRPEIVDDPTLTIHGGRHPVLDEILETSFVPNDTELGPASGPGQTHLPSLALITGPNMAGKSTYIRQVALIALLAHVGSFVPADRATIGLIDRIFTRVGAEDALHRGQSTFMVEMTEAANILHHASERSLVILDEIGRGTSTLDGLSLAWAMAEHLAGADATPGPRTLFATHYHELTTLEDRMPGRLGNLHVAVSEWGDEIVFQHRIRPGRTDQSYGIHVARLAGLPAEVIARAREVLESLAVHEGPSPGAPPPPDPGEQLPLFTQYLPHPVVEELRRLDPDHLSPIEAFEALRRLVKMIDGGDGPD